MIRLCLEDCNSCERVMEIIGRLAGEPQSARLLGGSLRFIAAGGSEMRDLGSEI